MSMARTVSVNTRLGRVAIGRLMRNKWQLKPVTKARNKKTGARWAPGNFPGRVSVATTELIRSAG